MKREEREQNTKYYEYTNVNPKDKFGCDCVIRAIAFALNQTWEQTVRELTEYGIKRGLVCNDKKLYPKFLIEKGFRQCAEPRNGDNTKMSAKKFINYIQEDDIIVAKVGTHHLTVIKDKKIHDTWDCSGNTMHKYWKLVR